MLRAVCFVSNVGVECTIAVVAQDDRAQLQLIGDGELRRPKHVDLLLAGGQGVAGVVELTGAQVLGLGHRDQQQQHGALQQLRLLNIVSYHHEI